MLLSLFTLDSSVIRDEDSISEQHKLFDNDIFLLNTIGRKKVMIR